MRVQPGDLEVGVEYAVEVRNGDTRAYFRARLVRASRPLTFDNGVQLYVGFAADVDIRNDTPAKAA